MMEKSQRFAFCLVAALLILLPACVEREELIQIHDDGAVTFALGFKADRSSELYPGRVPADEAAWRVMRSIELTPEGKEKHLAAFARSFAPAAPLPGTHASEGQPDKDLYLRFPTELLVEERPDGTYYHFKRTYLARPFAEVDSLESLVGGKRLKRLSEGDLKELSQRERVELIQGMARVEVRKKLVFARRAFLEVTPDAPQDNWLAFYEEAFQAMEGLDFDHIATLIRSESPEQEEELKAQAERFEKNMHDRLILVLRESCGYGEDQVLTFEERYRWHERFHEITENTGGEKFIIVVAMPGEIVGSNADKIKDGQAGWNFTGEAIRDRDHELLVTSRIRR
ncbi:MAG: hypothetical protein ACYTG7_04175 [Planctomycetota bacterium]|jgi:hypothetical protein